MKTLATLPLVIAALGSIVVFALVSSALEGSRTAEQGLHAQLITLDQGY